MIITVTANPAIDAVYGLRGALCSDGLNRAAGLALLAGGKGINVSRAATAAGVEGLVTVAMVGGASGGMFSDLLRAEGLPVLAVETACDTRINVCAVDPAGDACEINAPGGPVTSGELGKLTETVSGLAKVGDTVILAGSMPPVSDGDARSFWAELIRCLKGKGCRVILDCSGAALRCAVESSCPPDMIKPNLDELCELTGDAADGDVYESAECASVALAKRGIAVLATLGSKGAVFTPANEPETHLRQASVPVAQVVNVKGAGDTFLGTFATKLSLGESIESALAAASLAAAVHVSGGALA